MSKHRTSRARRIFGKLIPGSEGIDLATRRQARAVFGDALAGMRTKILLAVGLTIGATLTQLLLPWPLQVVLDRVLTPAATGSVESSHAYVLAGAGLAAAALPLLAARLTYAARVASAEIGKTATMRIRRRLFDHLNRLSLDFHTESRTGDLLVRLTGDVNLLRDMLFSSWLNLLDRGLYFLGLGIALLVLDWRLGLLALVPLPFLVVRVGKSSSELRTVVRSQRKREGSAAAFASEALSQIRVVKAYAAEDEAAERFSADAGKSEKQGVRAAKLAAEMELATQRVSAIGGAVVLFAGAILVLIGQLSTGVLLVAVSYAKSLYKPLRKVAGEAARLSKATAVTERVLEIFDRQPEPLGVGIPLEGCLDGHITATDLGYAYPEGDLVFEGVDLDIPPGSFVVLTGPNGAGKSTMLSLLLRFAEPTHGKLRVDGRPVDHYRLHDFRRRIAYVPQQILLSSGTIRENILLGTPDATGTDLRRAVMAARLGPVLARLPDGIDTIVGERGETLSGGEARRVMLARAAVRDADILLLDEPFEGIDAPSRPLVAESIHAIAAGRTTILVSHTALDLVRPDLTLTLAGQRLRTEALR